MERIRCVFVYHVIVSEWVASRKVRCLLYVHQ